MKLQKFTLEAAQKGKPLVTRDGRPAMYVAMLSKSNPEFPLLVEVCQNPEQKNPRLQQWTTENYCADGSFLGFVDDENDLFISDEETTTGPIVTNENQLEIFKTEK